MMMKEQPGEANDQLSQLLGDVYESKREEEIIHFHNVTKSLPNNNNNSQDDDTECNHNNKVGIGDDNDSIKTTTNMLSDIITTPSKDGNNLVEVIARKEMTEPSRLTTGNDDDNNNDDGTSMTEDSGSVGSSYLGSEGELKLSEEEEEETEKDISEVCPSVYNEEESGEEERDEATIVDINDRKVLSPKRIPYENSDEEEEEDTGAVNPYPPRSKHEVTYRELPIEPVNIEIPPDANIVDIGYVQSIVDDLVVVQSTIDPHKTLDVDSVLCFEDRRVLGRIFETFGPVRKPLYSIRLDSSENADKEWVLSRRKVYSVPDHSQFVHIQHLEKLRGCDASNRYDEELPEEEQEFSDDEKEATSRKRKTQHIKR